MFQITNRTNIQVLQDEKHETKPVSDANIALVY